MKRYKSWKEFPEYEPESGCTYSGRKELVEHSNQPIGSNPVINFIIL